MKQALLLASLIIIVLISGCTIPGNFFGSDVVNVQTKTVEDGPRDVVVVKGIQTIPTSPLLPEQQVLLSFVIENTDSLKNARNVKVDLFNAPLLYNMPTQAQPQSLPCNSYSTNRICVPDQCGLAAPCPILPGEEKPVNFLLLTSKESEIKGIKTDTKLSFKTTYEFDTSLNFIIPAINMEEIVKRQRSGDKTDLTITKSYGSGPVQIDAEIQGAPYIISNLQNYGSTVTNPESTLFFKIKNRGSGNIVNSEIDIGDMSIEFPPELEVLPLQNAGATTSQVVDANDMFTCTFDNTRTNCVNRRTSGSQEIGKIPLYKDESRTTIAFKVKLRQALQEPFRSFQIKATVFYDYELRNSVDMTINPFKNI